MVYFFSNLTRLYIKDAKKTKNPYAKYKKLTKNLKYHKYNRGGITKK